MEKKQPEQYSHEYSDENIDQGLAHIIDAASIQSLMDDFYALTGMPVGIVDLQGNILVKTGWQPICRDFHRVCTETLQNCIESNTILSSGVPRGSFHAYQCKNHMWDIVTPIFIGETLVGNLFCGQFFYEDEVPDPRIFIAHAEKYGFDTDAYLAALNLVPRLSREKVQNMMHFYAKFADFVSKLSYNNLKLGEMITTQKEVESTLRKREKQSRDLLSQLPDSVIVHQDGVIVYANQMLVHMLGFSLEELIGSNVLDYVVPGDRNIAVTTMAQRASGELVGDYEINVTDKFGSLHHVIVKTVPIEFNQTLGGNE